MAIPMTPPKASGAFLIEAGWGGAEIVPLAGDASFRRYFRVMRGAETAVLMDAPPPHEDPRPFIHIAEYLIGIGLSAPRIIHRDLDHGMLLIEDFGNERMREAIDADLSCEAEMYRGVVDVLVALHHHQPPAGLKRHGLDAWLDEVELFTHWYCPAVGLDVDQQGFRSAWQQVLSPIDMQGLSVTELRDFHAENIMLIDKADGIGRFGLLDFQDALIGHPAYDLVSMLEDARRDVTPAVETQMVAYYRQKTGKGASFDAAYWALGAQRNTRILGVFTRLWQRDNKPHYRQFQPRMWGLLDRNLAQPHLAPVKEWFDVNVPVTARAAAWAHLP